MAKKKDDRKGKGKASSDEQASPERTSGKQKGSYGASILPIRLTHAPREMFAWGVRLPTTEDNHVPPDMLSMITVWNPNDPQPATNAIGQPSSGQAAAEAQVAASSDIPARGDHDTREISSANPTPHAPETQAEEATPNGTPGSNPDVHNALPTPINQGSRLLSPISLPAVHPHLPYAAPYASPSPRFHPYRPPQPRFSSRPATQLEETHVWTNDGANGSHSRDVPQTFTASNAQVQVSSTTHRLPPLSVDPATGACFWPGNQAALHGVGVQTQGLGLNIGHPPTQTLYGHPTQPLYGYPTQPLYGYPTQPLYGYPTQPLYGYPTQPLYGYAEPLLQEPFAYPPAPLPQETPSFSQNAVAAPSSLPQEDPLMVDYSHLYHAGNAQPQWGIPQHQSNPDWPNQPVAGPSQYEESSSPALLGPLGVEGLSEFSAPEYWPLYQQDGNPPPPPGSQWP